MVAAGHEIGNHAYTHDRQIFRSLETIRYQVDTTNELIRSVGYEGEIFFRPPYGQKLFALPYYLDQIGMTTVTWDVDPERISRIDESTEVIVERTLEETKPGSIILLHVLGRRNESSRQALPEIIEQLREKGYRFVTLSELIRLKHREIPKD